jgi:hypothetical protein
VYVHVLAFCNTIDQISLYRIGKEYARADFRWGVSDPTVVALEILTFFGALPLCCCILRQLANDDPARHYWLVVLSTAELYGGYVFLYTSNMRVSV